MLDITLDAYAHLFYKINIHSFLKNHDQNEISPGGPKNVFDLTIWRKLKEK